MNEGAGYNEPGSSKFNLLDLKKGVRDHFMDGFQAWVSSIFFNEHAGHCKKG